MSSNAARRIAEDGALTEGMRRILADQAEATRGEPISLELLASIDDGIAEAERGECVDADVVLNELRARRVAAE